MFLEDSDYHEDESFKSWLDVQEIDHHDLDEGDIFLLFLYFREEATKVLH